MKTYKAIMTIIQDLLIVSSTALYGIVMLRMLYPSLYGRLVDWLRDQWRRLRETREDWEWSQKWRDIYNASEGE